MQTFSFFIFIFALFSIACNAEPISVSFRLLWSSACTWFNLVWISSRLISRAQLQVWGSRLIRTNSQTSGSWWEASWRWYERCSLLFPHSQILFFKDPGHASYAPATGGFHPMPHGTYVETHNRVVRIFSRRRANRNDSDYYILIDHTVLSRWGQCSRAAFHAVSITWRGYKDFK